MSNVRFPGASIATPSSESTAVDEKSKQRLDFTEGLPFLIGLHGYFTVIAEPFKQESAYLES